MTNTHVLPTTPDTTLGTVWKCLLCGQQTTPFSDAVCPGLGLHAHVSTASSDCDGPMYRDYVLAMNEDERASEFSDLEFKERVLGGQVSFHADDAEVHIYPEGFRYSEPTDEGYRSADVRWCEDDCDPSAYRQRDVFAEGMGY